MNYSDFLKRKLIADVPTGFEPSPFFFSDKLFGFQKDCVTWGCRRGRAAFFEDCGLGKTPQQLTWCDQVAMHTEGYALILAPLGVTSQTVREARKFGIDARFVSEQSEVKPGINITNYEKLHRFDLNAFDGLALDESSILKSYDGKTRNQIIEGSARIPFKLACTATPAPNDYMELGNHAEFLGVMRREEMLATFFVHDGGDTSKWRLKGHAEEDFWTWLCSWAVHLRKPSDLGYSDDGFVLPPLNLIEHCVDATGSMEGYLFALPASTLAERRNARRASIDDRCKLTADLATSNSEQWFIWCGLNDEAERIAKLTGFEEIRGSTPEDERERITLQFLDGSIRGMVSKPSIFGFGMNFQQCHNMACCGLSDSFEELYQLLRRFWRFGQKNPVNAHLIYSELEGAVIANLKRKEADAQRMSDAMVAHTSKILSAEIRGVQRDKMNYQPATPMKVPSWLQSEAA